MPRRTFYYLNRPLAIASDGVYYSGQTILSGTFSDALLARVLTNEITDADVPSSSCDPTAAADGYGLCGRVAIPINDSYDFALVEQGYGGVYVHTYELVKRLREKYRVLLLAPVAPLFEASASRHPDDVMPPLMDGLPADARGSMLSYVTLIRNILWRTKVRHLLVMHRSYSQYIFDIIERTPTTIYCDGYYDGHFAAFHELCHATDRLDLLGSIWETVSRQPSGFFGLVATPMSDPVIWAAGYRAMCAARSNWCWGHAQAASYSAALAGIATVPIELQLPFLSSEIFNPQLVNRRPSVLFTTTMHNIDKKGYIELGAVVPKLPRSVRVFVIVRQPKLLPRVAKQARTRMHVATLDKERMIRLYHRIWVNCRVSREESSPVSILESMMCGVPQIVSPAVASQIPIIEDQVTGFVVDPDDEHRLLQSLQRILSDEQLRNSMGNECRRRAVSIAVQNRMNVFATLLTDKKCTES